MTTFLSVYTPTYRRPNLLRACTASVEAQTVPVEHVIVRDHAGLGVGGMFADIPRHAHKVTGDYVMVLSDDNVLCDARFAEELEQNADGADVVVFKGDILGCVQPIVWDAEPEETKIDLSCFAVRRDVWQLHSDAWGHRYAGDFDFIHALWETGYRFKWWDRVAFEALRISQGRPE